MNERMFLKLKTFIHNLTLYKLGSIESTKDFFFISEINEKEKITKILRNICCSI